MKPDLTGITIGRFLQITLDAMSQLFFSLSVSMGIMITYGSYVKKDVDLNKAVSQIEIMDTGVAFLAGDHSGSIRILRTGWYVSRPGTDVCLIAESILLYGSGRKNHRNSVLRAGRICGVNILHLGTGIHYRKLYGIIPHRA